MVREDPGFIHAASQKAQELGHHWFGEEHVLLALFDEPPESPARRALMAAGLSYPETAKALSELLDAAGPPVPATPDGYCASAPSYHSVLGRAEGFALGMGQDAPVSEHGLLALLWQVGTSIDGVLSHLGCDRSALLAALAELGVSVLTQPSAEALVNPILGPAQRQAIQLETGFISDDEVMLALLNGEPDDVAQRVLAGCGVIYDSYRSHYLQSIENSDPPARRTPGVSVAGPNPRARQLLARAEGLAAAEGQACPGSQHGLISFVWDSDGGGILKLELNSTTGVDVARSLGDLGVSLPAVALPEPDRTQWGDRVFVPVDRLMEVVDRLHEEIPGHKYGFNTHQGRAWVVAPTDIDLQAVVDRVLTG